MGKVVFSNERKFLIFGIKGNKLVWRKLGTAFGEQNLVPTVKTWWRWHNDLRMYDSKWNRSVDFYRRHIRSHGTPEYCKKSFNSIIKILFRLNVTRLGDYTNLIMRVWFVHNKYAQGKTASKNRNDINLGILNKTNLCSVKHARFSILHNTA